MPSLMAASRPLSSRDGDVRLTDELLGELSLLAPLQRRPALYRFRGSVALRRYRAGELVVCQGERSASAYYVLTAADVLALLNGLCRAARPRRPEPELLAQREAVRERVDCAAAACEALRLESSPGPRLAGEYSAGALDAQYATLREGELCGEAACREGTPQPATVFAVRECYLLEMKADFLAAVQEDPVYKARADAAYRTHILRLQLGRLPLFRDLSDDEFGLVRDAVELRTLNPGELIYEEHDACDGLYLVRAGVVKLATGLSSLLGPVDVLDWTLLRQILRDGAAGRSPAAAVWRRLSSPARTFVQKAGLSAAADPAARGEIVYALNQLISATNLAVEPELRPLFDGILTLGPGPAARRANREVLESVLAAAVRPLAEARGTQCVLSYTTRGDAFGLSDLLLNRPRSATAVAFGHPNAAGRVEVAWLPAEAFWVLLENVPRLREPLTRETARQRREAMNRLATPVWDDGAPQFSREASELGLIQGQQLMLIDLDRCTRCDDCVRACASSREDGLSRLYLEGPRFGRHLVPTSCRACLDPVCLIGCPVGSIHRGPGQEIAIEDWCIGCGLCSESCPYGAIQMHDSGIIPETGTRWRFLPAEDLDGDAWQQRGFRDKNWPESVAPIVLDRTMREELGQRGLRRQSRSFAFRHDFSLAGDAAFAAKGLRLEVVSAGEVYVWVNGRECLPSEKPRGGRQVYVIAECDYGLRPGSNTVAARVTLLDESDTSREPLFQARLDALPADHGVEGTLLAPGGRPVTRRAAVCDLCAGQAGGPLCVRACPHDAARRVDARLGLPC